MKKEEKLNRLKSMIKECCNRFSCDEKFVGMKHIKEECEFSTTCDICFMLLKKKTTREYVPEKYKASHIAFLMKNKFDKEKI